MQLAAAGVVGSVAVTGTLITVASASPQVPPASADRARAAGAAPATEVVTKSVAIEARARAVDHRRASRAARQQTAVDAAAKRAALEVAEAERAAAATKARRAKKAARLALRARTTRLSRSSMRLSGEAASVLSVAAAQEGDRYAHGGDGPDTFDCSGFTMYVFAQVGVSLPHSSSAQRRVARPVSPAEVQPGDLVFVYNGGGGSIGHVAIYGGPGVWYEASNYGRAVGKHRAWSSNVSYGRVL